MSSKASQSDTNRLYYPVFLDIEGKPCLVIGGGKVAERKVSLLFRCNANVTVVSPVVSVALADAHNKGKIRWIHREYMTDDLRDNMLIFACTNSTGTNEKIKREASRLGIPVNVADNQALCDFIVPSVTKKNGITIAISTSGELPLFSRRLRKKIEETITDEYIEYLHLVAGFRKYLIKTVKDPVKRNSIMKKVSSMEIDEVVQMGFDRLKNLLDPEL